MFIATLGTSPSICCNPRGIYEEDRRKWEEEEEFTEKQQLSKRNGVGGIGGEGHRRGCNYPQAKPLVLNWRLVWPQRDIWQSLETFWLL